jgi:hypothetical protein
MKRHLSIRIPWPRAGNPANFYFELPHVGLFRAPKTTTLNRQSEAVMSDPEMRELKLAPRGKQRQLPTAWDDKQPARASGKSWKDFTRKRKPWL